MTIEEQTCPRLSLGIDSTLGNWRDLTAKVFGPTSAAVLFWDDKIAEQGREEWVLADEQQTLAVVAQLHIQGLKQRADDLRESIVSTTDQRAKL